MKIINKIIALYMVVIGVKMVWPHLTHVDDKGIAMLSGFVVYALVWVFIDTLEHDGHVVECSTTSKYTNYLCHVTHADELYARTIKKITKGGKH